MIDLYTWPTPNGHKIHIMLEETGLDYEVIPVDIGQGDQFDPEFLRISPNNKMPAIVDRDGPGGEPYPMFESGAILMYLAEKTGRFMPQETAARYRVVQWLMFQMGHIGPMLGQAHHFRAYAPEQIPYAVERYTNEAGRLYHVLDRQLAAHEYVAADEYTIADMAIFPWCRLHKRQNQDIDDYPNVKRWFTMIAARPAVAKDMGRLEDIVEGWTKESWEAAFGGEQYKRR